MTFNSMWITINTALFWCLNERIRYECFKIDMKTILFPASSLPAGLGQKVRTKFNQVSPDWSEMVSVKAGTFLLFLTFNFLLYQSFVYIGLRKEVQIFGEVIWDDVGGGEEWQRVWGEKMYGVVWDDEGCGGDLTGLRRNWHISLS